MKKKILLMVPMLHQGGFERVCIRTARLLQNKYHVSIIVFSDEDIAYDISGISVININIKTTQSYLGKIINVIRRAYAVYKIKESSDAIVCYSFGITANLINVLSKNKVKIWVGLRGFTDLDSFIHPLICKRSDLIICCSAEIREQVKKRFPNKKTVYLYNPYNVNEIQKLSEEKLEDKDEFLLKHDPIIVSMGREDDVKGFWHLLRSFSNIAGKFPQARLIIIGEGQFTEYKKFAKRLNITEKVFFTGVRKNPFSILAKANIYVLTSSNEGFPNALVEAMALGIPVIATDCKSGPREILSKKKLLSGSIKESLFTDYGVLIPVMDEHKNLESLIQTEEENNLSSIMELLINNKALAGRYSEKSKIRAAHFSDQSYFERLDELLNLEI